jgi:hypothetical protein
MTTMTRRQVLVSSALVASAYLLPVVLYLGVIRPIDRAPTGGPGDGAVIIASLALALGILMLFGTVGAIIAAFAARNAVGRERKLAIVLLIAGCLAVVGPWIALYLARA